MLSSMRSTSNTTCKKEMYLLYTKLGKQYPQKFLLMNQLVRQVDYIYLKLLC